MFEKSADSLFCNLSQYTWLLLPRSAFFVTIAVKSRKRFVNVRLHCIVSNLKSISKISTLLPMEKFLRTLMEGGLRPF